MNAVAHRPDHAREIRYALTDPYALCASLGFIAGKGSFVRQGTRGVTVCCPFHEEKSPSCSVRIAGDGTISVRCFGCGATGDALSLIAAKRGMSIVRDFRQVLIEAAVIAGLHGVVAELETGTTKQERPAVPPPRAAALPERTYPPIAEVLALLERSTPVADDVEAAAMLAARKIDPERISESGIARVIPRADAALPAWARYQGRSWAETGHRLIVPMRTADGAVASVRAWRVSDGESPKRLPPAGHKASGLVMACDFGTAFLTGRIPPPRVLIAEGEPDFFVATTWRQRELTARIGIVSGSWTPELARKFAPGQSVGVWTDRDEAGDRYAQEILRSLKPRGVNVGRWQPKENA